MRVRKIVRHSRTWYISIIFLSIWRCLQQGHLHQKWVNASQKASIMHAVRKDMLTTDDRWTCGFPVSAMWEWLCPKECSPGLQSNFSMFWQFCWATPFGQFASWSTTSPSCVYLFATYWGWVVGEGSERLAVLLTFSPLLPVFDFYLLFLRKRLCLFALFWRFNAKKVQKFFVKLIFVTVV